MNKQFLVVVPLVIMVAGCSAQGENPAPTNSVASNSEPQVETVVNAATEMKETANADAEKKPQDKNADDKADSKYIIVEEADPRMPAELIAALEKVKVSPPPAAMTVPKKARLRLLTSKGTITVELNETAAPLHAKNFLYLSRRGFYDNTILHRYEPGFVIQGGDPLSKSPALKEYFGAGGPGYQVPRERNSLKHEKFVLAAARSPEPDSAGSQFYFTLAPALFLDDGDGYTVFGKIVDGSENVLKLRAGDKLQKVVILPVTPAKKAN